ncbi:MAG: Dihydropteroate synthase [Nitrospira sp.]|nr:MAG: Dihydropteroate synthase [Nitrospira sp.]
MTGVTVTSSKHLVLTAGPQTFHLESGPLVMGILNVTPDSFSDGGVYVTVDQALSRAKQMQEEGADIIDVGAESSRPGARPIDESEELRRLIPVLEAVCGGVSIPISVDTTKAAVARRAIQAGATIVNDISALYGDPLMASLVAETGAAVVLMHMQGTPQTMQQSPRYRNVVDEVSLFLRERTQVALDHGIRPSQIILDPGFGFGKLQEHNLQLLAEFDMLTRLGYPVLAGLSRKQFIGHLTGRQVHERDYGTAGAVAVAVLKGAHIIRAHDVRAMRDTITVVSTIARRSRSGAEESHA